MVMTWKIHSANSNTVESDTTLLGVSCRDYCGRHRHRHRHRHRRLSSQKSTTCT